MPKYRFINLNNGLIQQYTNIKDIHDSYDRWILERESGEDFSVSMLDYKMVPEPMSTYRIEYSYTGYGHVDIQAHSQEEAEQKFNDNEIDDGNWENEDPCLDEAQLESVELFDEDEDDDSDDWDVDEE